jgi:hypothetical protein
VTNGSGTVGRASIRDVSITCNQMGTLPISGKRGRTS